jgi:chromosome segregation ATPase
MLPLMVMARHAGLPKSTFAPMLALMNNKGLIFVLLLVSVGLGIALIVVNKEAADQKKDADEKSVVASNQVVSVKRQLDDLESVNQTLDTNLAAARADFSNKLALSDANLRTTEASLEKAVAEAKAEAKAQADSNAVVLAQRDAKISELESENQSLDKEAASLRIAITNVQARIVATQEKLAKSQGDQAFLLKELKILQDEEADMEKKFNNIAAVREQLHKLKTEAAIDRRLDWMRRGMSDSFMPKGGELLIQHSRPAAPPASSGAVVELRQSGGVKIQTNAPPK